MPKLKFDMLENICEMICESRLLCGVEIWVVDWGGVGGDLVVKWEGGNREKMLQMIAWTTEGGELGREVKGRTTQLDWANYGTRQER
jgi:hypothetical protein